MLRHVFAIAAVGFMVAIVAPAMAQQNLPSNFPSKTVRIIVSGPAGGGVDIVARLFGDKLQKHFGHSFVIETRPGAGGNLGAEVVASAEPDGYTLLAAQPAALTTNVFLYPTLRFDPNTFEPLAIMTSIPNALAVRNDLPVNSIRELIAYARAYPGKLNYGSQGNGTTPHLTTELFSRLTGIKLTHVPYRGTVQAVNDLVAGHVDTVFIQLDAVRELYRVKKIRLLAVMTERRLESLPEILTAIEEGVAGFTSSTWNALVAPPKTPALTVAALNRAANEVLKSPETVEHLRRSNMEPIGGTPAEVKDFIRRETERWG